MEFNVKEETKTKLRFTLKGEDHTFCNLLKSELWNNKDVIVSSYKIDHPLIGLPIFLIETNGKTGPRDALKNAVKNLKDNNKEILKSIAKLK